MVFIWADCSQISHPLAFPAPMFVQWHLSQYDMERVSGLNAMAGPVMALTMTVKLR